MAPHDYHEAFWTAIAAAAPVIALAGVVTITDAGVAGNILRLKKKQMISEETAKETPGVSKKDAKNKAKKDFYKLTGGRRDLDSADAAGNGRLKRLSDWAVVHPLLGPQYMWVIIYSVVNLVLQGGVLIVALLALLHEDATIPHTTISGTWIVVVEIIGLAFLLIVALLAGQVGRQRQRVEAAEKDGEAQKLAQYLADAKPTPPPPAPQQ
jgi:hypothetical protein